MSTILKALRRLEEDRNAQASRPLREAVTRGSEDGRGRRRSGWLLATALGLVVGLGASGTAYYLALEKPASPSETQLAEARSPEPSSERAEPRAARAAPAAQSTSPPPTVVTVSETTREALSPEALTSSVEMIARPPAEPRIDADEPAPSASRSREPETAKAARGSQQPGVSAGAERRRAERAAAATVPRGSLRPSDPRARASEPRSDGDPWEVAVARDAASREAPPPAPSRPAARPAPERSAPARAAAAPEPSRPAATSEKSRPAATPEPSRPATTRPVTQPEPSRPGATRTAAVPEPSKAATASSPPRPAAAPEPSRPASEPEPKPPEAARVAAAPKPAAEAPPPPAPKAKSEPKVIAVVTAPGDVPGVRVEKTFWHPSAERRTALIQVEGGVEEIREGDSVGSLRVSTIEPSGVVFDQQGREFRRRVGEK